MKSKIKNRIINYVKSNYKLLDSSKFLNGKTYCNHRCHLNAVQEAYENGDKVCLTVCIGGGKVIVHFINQDSKGHYIDNTLGWYGKELYNYYLVKEVTPNEYKKIWNLLIDTKKMLINTNSSWLERKLAFIKEDDI